MNKKVVGRTIALLIILVLILGVFGFFTGTLFTVKWEKKATPTEQSLSWMSEIPDDTKISSMSIPGTHDSASLHLGLGYCLQTQDTNIAAQLDNGYRYLDIRLDLNEEADDFEFIHASGDCRTSAWPLSKQITLTDTLDDVYVFLEDHPSETVIFAVKFEDSEDDVATNEKLLLDIISKNQDKWYTENAIPTMGQARGKVILATRFQDEANMGDDKLGLQLDWPKQDETEAVEDTCSYTTLNGVEALVVQDRYKYTVDDKIAAVLETIEGCQASDNCLSINFASLSGQYKIPHPCNYAKVINQELYNAKLKSETAYGIIAVDFGDQALAEYIYNTNFKSDKDK